MMPITANKISSSKLIAYLIVLDKKELTQSIELNFVMTRFRDHLISFKIVKKHEERKILITETSPKSHASFERD